MASQVEEVQQVHRGDGAGPHYISRQLFPGGEAEHQAAAAGQDAAAEADPGGRWALRIFKMNRKLYSIIKDINRYKYKYIFPKYFVPHSRIFSIGTR